MGVDHEAALVVGFAFTEDDLLDAFGEQRPRQTHWEDVFDGEEFDNEMYGLHEIAERICQRIPSSAYLVDSDPYTGDSGSVYIEPAGIPSSPSYDEIALLGPRLDTIQEALHDLGLRPTDPIVQAVLLVY